MRTIDTNVIVRLLVDDDVDQRERAQQLVSSGPVFVPTTVMLEAAWVLKSVYGLAALEIVASLSRFAGSPTVQLEDPERAFRSLELARQGMDVADAFHLTAAPDADSFFSFDKRLAKISQRIGFGRVEEP